MIYLQRRVLCMSCLLTPNLWSEVIRFRTWIHPLFWRRAPKATTVKHLFHTLLYIQSKMWQVNIILDIRIFIIASPYIMEIVPLCLGEKFFFFQTFLSTILSYIIFSKCQRTHNAVNFFSLHILENNLSTVNKPQTEIVFWPPDG